MMRGQKEKISLENKRASDYKQEPNFKMIKQET